MEGSRPHHAGIGFFPEPVVIRSYAPVPDRQAQGWDDEEYALEAAPKVYQGPETWRLWKDWHTNPSGHGGKKAPPKFVAATANYDELGRTVADGFEVEVDAGEVRVAEEGKASGEDMASWYRSLAMATPAPLPARATKQPSVTTSNAVTASTAESKPRIQLGEPSSSHSSVASSSRSSPQPPVRVHRSEWFIRRALATASKSAPVSKPATPPPSLGIGSLVTTAPKPRPPPRPRYHIGPDNAGYARLAGMGWGGGGLGRPEGWEDDGERISRPRSAEIERKLVVDSDGVVDLTGDSGSDESASEEEPARDGPGRILPIETALKLDRLGLGRGRVEKRVTHSVNEISEAQRRAKGKKRQEEMPKTEKIKWAQREKKERESRKRIMAALNA